MIFDEEIERRGTGCMKWDECDSEEMLPLWVADMDFRVAQPIQQALENRVAHGVFGYSFPQKEYYDAVINWFQRRHGWTMQRKWLIYTSGVVPAVSAIIKAVTMPGEGVMMLTPVYNCFYSSIRNNGCWADEVPLVRQDDTYIIDYRELERHAMNPNVTAFLLCNPHNPGGRVWKREELCAIGEICKRNDVFVIADEIHCELVMPGHEYIPFASLGEDFLMNSATCTSPSKAFNIAGLQIANIAVADALVRRRIDKAININEVCDVNPFGIVALQAAYNEGEEWLEQLKEYLYGNYCFAKAYLEEHLPMVKVMKLEGTYLLWLDVSALTDDSLRYCARLKRDAKVWFAAGSAYGKAGEGYIRVNLACTRKVLEEALNRWKTEVEKIKE